MAIYLVVLALAVTPIVLAFAVYFHPSLRALFAVLPTPAALVVFCVATIMVLFSFAAYRWWSMTLFAIPPRYVYDDETRNHDSGQELKVLVDGRAMRGQVVPEAHWDWYAEERPQPVPIRRVRRPTRR